MRTHKMYIHTKKYIIGYISVLLVAAVMKWEAVFLDADSEGLHEDLCNIIHMQHCPGSCVAHRVPVCGTLHDAFFFLQWRLCNYYFFYYYQTISWVIMITLIPEIVAYVTDLRSIAFIYMGKQKQYMMLYVQINCKSIYFLCAQWVIYI